MWCVAELDQEYIEKMEDMLEVYERPLSTQEPVVCVDEKPVNEQRRRYAAPPEGMKTGASSEVLKVPMEAI